MAVTWLWRGCDVVYMTCSTWHGCEQAAFDFLQLAKMIKPTYRRHIGARVNAALLTYLILHFLCHYCHHVFDCCHRLKIMSEPFSVIFALFTQSLRQQISWFWVESPIPSLKLDSKTLDELSCSFQRQVSNSGVVRPCVVAGWKYQTERISKSSEAQTKRSQTGQRSVWSRGECLILVSIPTVGDVRISNCIIVNKSSRLITSPWEDNGKKIS